MALISAVGEEPFRRDGSGQNLIAVVKTYITQHLADADLGAERIAQGMFISGRQLYKVWESEPSSLSQWIVERRLDAARQDLTSRRGRSQTIAAVARRWGSPTPRTSAAGSGRPTACRPANGGTP